MGDLNVLLSSLEERLAQHDNNKREVEGQVQNACSEMQREVGMLGKSFNEGICNSFSTTEKRTNSLIDLLNGRVASQEIRGVDFLMRQVQYKLSTLETYEVQYSGVADGYTLIAVSVPVPVSFSPGDITSNNPGDIIKVIEHTIGALKEHLSKNQESVNSILEALRGMSDGKWCGGSELENKVIEKLGPLL